MASAGALSPCNSPTKPTSAGTQACPAWRAGSTNLRSCAAWPAALQHHPNARRHLIAAAAAANSSTDGSMARRTKAMWMPALPGSINRYSIHRSKAWELGSSSHVCSSAAAGGPHGPTSSSNSNNDTGLGADTSSPSLPRAASPVSTAQQPFAPLTSQNSSSSTSSTNVFPVPGTADAAEVQDVALNPAAAAAVVVLPAAVVSRPSAAADGAAAAMAAAAAAAEAAVAEGLDAQTGGAFEGSSAGGAVGLSPAADLQDLFTLLKFQVVAQVDSSQQAATLMPIVRYAAAGQLPLSAVMTVERQQLLLQLMGAEDPAVAVLAAEAWCRVCGEVDLKPYTAWLLPAVPVLLGIIRDNWLPEGRRVPLVFFAVSSLVRMSSLREVALAVEQQQGLPLLVAALNVAPAAICQVTTFALFRLMRELDGVMADEQLASWHETPAATPSPAVGAAPAAVGAAAEPKAASGDGCGQLDQQERAHGNHELALLQYVRAGAFPKLFQVLAQVEDGSAHDLAFSMLLSMALVPEAQQLVAERGEVQHVVQVMVSPPSRGIRLEAMLVLGRLAARNRACQQDAVREGVVPVLVDMTTEGSDEERCHGCRLLAILGQHETTHQTILQSGSLPVVLQLLRDQGRASAAGAAQHFTREGQSVQAWDAPASADGVDTYTTANNRNNSVTNNSISSSTSTSSTSSTSSSTSVSGNPQGLQEADDDDGNTADCDSDSDNDNDSDSEHTTSSMYRTSGPFKAAKRPEPHGTQVGAPAAAAGAAASGATKAQVGPELVLEQAVGLVCMLSHNPDNHFLLVNQGLVPLLIPLLQQGTPPKTQTYTLASLMMLCMAETRNAAVVARAGAVPLLVSIARESSYRAVNRELSAALLAVLSRNQAVQVDVVASGGIPALTRLLDEGSPGARCSAAEALTQIANTSDVRCRLIVRAGALSRVAAMLKPEGNATTLLWAARLVKALAQEHNTLWEVCETPGLLSVIPELLMRRPGQQDMQRLIQEFRAAASSAATTTAASTAGADTDGSSASDSNAAAAAAAAATAEGSAHPKSSTGLSSPRRAQHNVGDSSDLLAGRIGSRGSMSLQPQQQRQQQQASGDDDAHDEPLEKAQAHLAWLLAALSMEPRTRHIMSELSGYLVRPLVVLLRDSQALSGPGYTLHDVMHGMANNRQAAASAALRALWSTDPSVAALIQHELALQIWLGHNVQLPKAAGNWPPAPGWF